MKNFNGKSKIKSKVALFAVVASSFLTSLSSYGDWVVLKEVYQVSRGNLNGVPVIEITSLADLFPESGEPVKNNKMKIVLGMTQGRFEMHNPAYAGGYQSFVSDCQQKAMLTMSNSSKYITRIRFEGKEHGDFASALGLMNSGAHVAISYSPRIVCALQRADVGADTPFNQVEGLQDFAGFAVTTMAASAAQTARPITQVNGQGAVANLNSGTVQALAQPQQLSVQGSVGSSNVGALHAVTQPSNDPRTQINQSAIRNATTTNSTLNQNRFK